MTYEKLTAGETCEAYFLTKEAEITNETECQNVATSLELQYGGPTTLQYTFPACYQYTDDKVYFNLDFKATYTETTVSAICRQKGKTIHIYN